MIKCTLLERSGTSANVSPSILHLAEHNGSYANAKVLTLCGRFLFILHSSLRVKRALYSRIGTKAAVNGQSDTGDKACRFVI